MKRVILVLFVAVFVFIILISYQKKQKSTIVTAPIKILIEKPTIAAASKTNNSEPGNASVANIPQSVNDRERTNEIRQYMESQNRPIDFYGLVIDQDGNPVPGVKISGRVLHLNVIVPAPWGTEDEIIPVEKESDAAGRFEINNVAGRAFEVESIQKNGYIISPKFPRDFNPGIGSLERPVIIKTWKEMPKEMLITGRHVFGIDLGKIYTLDLEFGKKNEGETEGDLTISIKRPSDANSHDRFQWSYFIQAMQGGFAEADTNDDFMYIAPQSGYLPKIEAQFDASDPAWVGIVKKQFFLKSRGGQIYGRAQIEIDSIYNAHCAIKIDYTINPNGSRNLQP